MIGSTLNDRAAASKRGKKYEPPPGAVAGLKIIATRLMFGAISVSNWNHLLIIEGSTYVKPVRFPPGWAKLAANPSLIGSATTTNTIGIACVSRLTAAVPGVEAERMTS